MNSDDSNNRHIKTGESDRGVKNSGLSDYETEGLSILDKIIKEGRYFPGLDAEYPLRNPSEDPRWAVRTVKIWIGIGLFSILFILTMTILGIWYD